MDEMNDLYKRMVLTAEEIGLAPIQDEFCCQLLATLYVHGSEVMVLDHQISADLLVAQKRLNLYGAELPNADLVPVVRKYIHELEKNEHPDWLTDLEKHYGVKLTLKIGSSKEETIITSNNEQHP